MANVERIRGAIGEWRYFKENPQDIQSEIDDWVKAIVEGIRRGYQVAIIDGEHVEELEEESTLHVPKSATYEIEIPEGDPLRLSDSFLNEYALRLLEASSDILASDARATVLWLKYNQQSGELDAEFAFDVLDL